VTRLPEHPGAASLSPRASASATGPDGPCDDKACGSGGSGGSEPGLGAVPDPESQSLRKPGPNIVAALINIRGHGPAVTTVYVPHVPPRTKNTRSR
jgi:hypothetical protein